MASYQARQRDPLLDQNVQAMLQRRGKEVIGLALIALALPEAAPEADRPWSAALFLAYGGLALIAADECAGARQSRDS